MTILENLGLGADNPVCLWLQRFWVGVHGCSEGTGPQSQVGGWVFANQPLVCSVLGCIVDDCLNLSYSTDGGKADGRYQPAGNSLS